MVTIHRLATNLSRNPKTLYFWLNFLIKNDTLLVFYIIFASPNKYDYGQ